MVDQASLLEKAIALAGDAHAGQTDKAGRPYILHPLRVMMAMADDTDMVVAVLHDVIEDTDITTNDLREQGFPEEVVVAVDCLSRRDGEDYYDFVRRAITDPIACRVKRADLMDNMNTTRLPAVTDKDKHRMQRYQKALTILDEMEAT